MLFLKSELFIGSGSHKNCYIHPLNDSLCIKVSNNDSEKIVEKEIMYQNYLEKKGFNSDIIPRYHGIVETNFGKGYVFDLIRDFDGNISKSIGFYLKNEELYSNLIKAFQNLEKNMIKNILITRKLKERNLLYQKTDENHGKIIIVDDIGPTEFIPLEIFSSFFAKKKIMRKIKEFKKKVISIYF